MRICIIGKFPPIQGGVSMRTYWSAHGLAARGHEVHVVTNAKEAVAPFRMHMRCGGLEALRGGARWRLGDGALDRPGRSLAVLHSDGQSVRLEARRHRGAGAFRAAIRRHLFPLSGALWGRRTGSPHK